MYIPRYLEQTVQRYSKIFPVVYLMGPRQSGKSTLLQHMLSNKYKYVSFDDDVTRQLFIDDPKAFMTNHNDHVIFDEAQKVPELFNAVKLLVDNDRHNYGKFILTGSTNFLLLDQIKETLAGRVGVLQLLPLQYAETPPELRQQSIISGFYPEPIQQKYQYTREWYSSYLSTYIERDVKLIQDIGDLRSYRQLIQLLAANTSQQLNYSYYAKQLGIATNTIKRWVSILEISFIIYLLPPYHNNFGKRVIKAPKVYFYDTGLVAYLTGIRDYDSYNLGPMSGALFENFIVIDLLKQTKNMNYDCDFYYYRTSDGAEVDLIVDYKNKRHYFEIKKNATYKSKMLAPIRNIMTKDDVGSVIYQGENIKIEENLSATNYEDLLLNNKALDDEAQ